MEMLFDGRYSICTYGGNVYIATENTIVKSMLQPIGVIDPTTLGGMTGRDIDWVLKMANKHLKRVIIEDKDICNENKYIINLIGTPIVYETTQLDLFLDGEYGQALILLK